MKNLIAKIVSKKMAKTVVVETGKQTIHPLYKKVIKKTSRFKAHNEDETLKVGDTVKVVPTKPISKDKHYKIVAKL